MKVVILAGGYGTEFLRNLLLNQNQWWKLGYADSLAYYEGLFALWL